MMLAVDGEIAASGASPGLLSVEPNDPLCIGFDSLTAVGDYDTPNRLRGMVRRWNVADP